MKIQNLYREKEVLNFKRLYAMEKIHGTSAHISWKDGQLHFFSGGESHINFVKLFDAAALEARFKEVGRDVIVFGEAYGGKQQGMSATYGPNLKFVAFDVKVGEDGWMNVPRADAFVKSLGLEFVHYQETDSELESLNKLRDCQSVQANRNGVEGFHKMEGIVLRPLEEYKNSYGERVICKHKRDDFRETKTPRAVSDDELQVLTEATAIADEWVTEMRITHVLDKIEGGAALEKMGMMINAVLEDIKLESEGEIEWSKEAEKAVKTKAAIMIKRRLTIVKTYGDCCGYTKSD